MCNSNRVSLQQPTLQLKATDENRLATRSAARRLQKTFSLVCKSHRCSLDFAQRTQQGNEMKTGFALIGVLHVTMWLLGSFGALDYHLCIKAPAGTCSKAKSEELK